MIILVAKSSLNEQVGSSYELREVNSSLVVLLVRLKRLGNSKKSAITQSRTRAILCAMRTISSKFRKQFDIDPYFKLCARSNPECEGRITIEHAFIYGGKQIDELWNFVPLCWFHHLGNGLDKNTNQKLAIMRASDEDLEKYPKKNWPQLRKYLLTTT